MALTLDSCYLRIGGPIDIEQREVGVGVGVGGGGGGGGVGVGGWGWVGWK